MAVRVPLKFPASRRPVTLYDKDIATAQATYNVGYNAVVREIFHKHCEGIRQRQKKHLEELPNVPGTSELSGSG